jgi:hypothetical protein
VTAFEHFLCDFEQMLASSPVRRLTPPLNEDSIREVTLQKLLLANVQLRSADDKSSMLHILIPEQGILPKSSCHFRVLEGVCD